MALGNLAPSQGGSLASFGFCGNYLSGAVPVPWRTGVTLIGYPTSEGYDPVACQFSESPTPPAVVPFAPFAPPATDPPPPSSSTTTTTTTTTTTIAPSSSAEDTADSEQPSGPVWNTLTVQPGGTTASQIRLTLGLTGQDAIYAWDAATQRWQTTSPARTIPAGTAISFRTQQRISQDALEETNLGTGTRRTTLTSGWNILSAPTQIQQPQTTSDTEDSTDTTSTTGDTDSTASDGFLFASELVDCDSPTAILAVASYNPITRQWSLWLPCHPAAQARLTTGDNPPYQPLTAISPAHTTYIYTRTSQPVNIAWNPDTSQYQPS